MRLVKKKLQESGHLTKLEISFLLDGEMKPKDAKSARKHIDNCAKCSARGRRMKRADEVFRRSQV